MLTIKEQIFKQIDRSRQILLTFPADWDVDAVSATLALFLALKKLGKKVDVVAQKMEDNIKSLTFLPGYGEIKEKLEHLRRFIVSIDISQTKVSQIKYLVENDQLNFIISPENGWFETKDVKFKAGEFKYDLIIVLGANDLESLGSIYDKNIEFFYKTPIINIACQAANEEFGQINFLDLNTSTVSESIFDLLKTKSNLLVDENIATCLLGGILLKTRNFKSGNLSPETLMNSSQLINLGGRREEIVNQLHRHRQVSDLKLWGKILYNLHLDPSKEIAWSFIKKMDGVENIKKDSLQDLAEDLISNLPNVKAVLILLEKNEKNSEAFLFSFRGPSAVQILKDYRPSGNQSVAHALVDLSIENAIKTIINSTRKYLIN